MNYLGTKLRELRQSQGSLLHQIATQIDVDPALMSKMERGERRAQWEHIAKIATVLNTKQDDLTVLWLADRINDVYKMSLWQLRH